MRGFWTAYFLCCLTSSEPGAQGHLNLWIRCTHCECVASLYLNGSELLKGYEGCLWP